MVTVVFVLLIVILQLNIILSRNHSFWWFFSDRTAPRPSLIMLTPVFVFMLAATFISVYWPLHVQPDGGRGDFRGAGVPSSILKSLLQHASTVQIPLSDSALAVMHRAACIVPCPT